MIALEDEPCDDGLGECLICFGTNLCPGMDPKTNAPRLDCEICKGDAASSCPTAGSCCASHRADADARMALSQLLRSGQPFGVSPLVEDGGKVIELEDRRCHSIEVSICKPIDIRTHSMSTENLSVVTQCLSETYVTGRAECSGQASAFESIDFWTVVEFMKEDLFRSIVSDKGVRDVWVVAGSPALWFGPELDDCGWKYKAEVSVRVFFVPRSGDTEGEL